MLIQMTLIQVMLILEIRVIGDPKHREKMGAATTCYVDCKGVIVKTNSHFENMKPEDFIGLTLADFMEEPSRTEYLDLLRKAVEQGEVGSYNNTIISATGKSHWHNRISPWREGGKIIGAIMIGNQLLD